MSLFLENSPITAFCKKPDLVNQLEKAFKDLRNEYLPLLEKALGPRVARLEITVYMTVNMPRIPKRSLHSIAVIWKNPSPNGSKRTALPIAGRCRPAS